MARNCLMLVLRTSSAALALASAISGTSAMAQDVPAAVPTQDAPAMAATQEEAAPAPKAAAQDGAEIIVTGSRLGRTSFNSPTPVNVISQERAQDLNITSVGDALNQIPSFRPIATPATQSFRSSANIAGRSLDLRGLGSIRTLTLIDGRRHVSSADDGNFDLNSIPSIMIQRSEVVTGGASAAYGAGAVSGVVNLITDRKLNGMKAEASYGISEKGDARNVYLGFEAGHSFAGGRGHAVIGAEYSDEGPVTDYNSRDWSRRHHDFVPNPFFSTNPALSNGLPATVGSDNVTTSLTPAGSITVVNPLQGMQFDANGNLVPFQFGALYNKAKPSSLMIGGDPSITDYYGAVGPLVVGTKHGSVLGHVDFELSSALTVSAELGYAEVTGGPTGANPRSDPNGALKINRDNAYLTPATAALMDAAHITVLPVSRINFELGPNVYSSKNETTHAFVGARGSLFGDWKWDAFYQYGQTTGRQSNANSRLEQRFKDSIDAVRAPAGLPGIAAGTIICRTTIANPTNGCVPANIMGPDKISAAAAAWVNTTAFSTRTFTDQTVAANFRGTLINGWAGPISAAAGVEYRTSASEGDNDQNSKLGLFSQIAWTFLPATTQKVTEGYVEVNVPVFKDWVLGKSLELDGAVRRTHYSLSGSATTWKGGAVYRVNDEYMFRVTRSRDIRAPSPLELNPNRSVTTLSLADPKYGVQYLMPSFNGGNPNLKLESADTFTAGVVLQPAWFPKFSLSVDYYDIKVRGAIDIPSVNLAISLCRAGGNPGICTLGTDNNGNPDRILALFATYQNINQLHTEGFEFVSHYALDLADVWSSVGGNLDFMLNGSIVKTLSTTLADGTKKELSNWTGNSGGVANTAGVPRWRADAVITYSQPTFSVTAHVSHIPKALQNPDWIGPEQAGYSPYLPNSVNDNSVSARTYLDLSARAKVFGGENSNFEVFGSVNNVFDTDPPSQLRLNGNGLYFNPIGRSYKMGIRAKW
jgi:outer membrane receptor protein involved in Fe transport